MKVRGLAVFNAGLFVAAIGVVGFAAVPVLRHMAGVVVFEAIDVPNAPAARPPSQQDVAAILALAPFGQTARVSQASSGAVDTIPAFELRGIFASSSGQSTALLDVDGTPGLFRETMPVGGGYAVAEIAFDYVQLARDEVTILLRFNEDAERVGADAGDGETAEPDLLARMRSGLVVPAKYERPAAPETTAEYIDYWRTRIQKNPKAVLDEIGLTATEAGYVIADRHDVGVRLAGLKSGDLVRSVNGQQVGDPDKDRRFYDQIAAAGHARLEVERGGRVLTFSFPLR